MHPSDRLVTISLRPQLLAQLLEIALQILRVLILRDVVHTNRRVLAQPPKGAAKQFLVDQMGERVEPGRRLPFRSFRYLPESR